MEKRMREEEETIHSVPYATYIRVWIALLALTATTVGVTRFHLLDSAIVVAILIASAKAGLILTFFMHMRYEAWILRVMLLFALLSFTSILALTFTDVWYR